MLLKISFSDAEELLTTEAVTVAILRPCPSVTSSDILPNSSLPLPLTKVCISSRDCWMSVPFFKSLGIFSNNLESLESIDYY